MDAQVCFARQILKVEFLRVTIMLLCRWQQRQDSPLESLNIFSRMSRRMNLSRPFCGYQYTQLSNGIAQTCLRPGLQLLTLFKVVSDPLVLELVLNALLHKVGASTMTNFLLTSILCTHGAFYRAVFLLSWTALW